MAAGAWTQYSNATLGMTNGLFALGSNTFVMVFVTNSYTPAVNTHSLWSDVIANELPTASGYTAGGVVLAGVSNTLSTATVTFTATSPSWATFSAGPFRYGVIVKRAGASLVSGDLLLAYNDLGGGSSITGSGNTYSVTFSGSGILQFAHSP